MTETTTASEIRPASLVNRAQHTPGPWIATGNVRPVEGVDEPLFCGEIAELRKTGWRGTIASIQSCDFINGITREEAEANARLIAAAPEMLAALEFALADPCFPLLGSVTQDVVRAAIDKATGAE